MEGHLGPFTPLVAKARVCIIDRRTTLDAETTATTNKNDYTIMS